MAFSLGNFNWQCQHCTFINSVTHTILSHQNRIICSVCGKSISCIEVHQQLQKQQGTETVQQKQPSQHQPTSKPRRHTLKPSTLEHQERSFSTAGHEWNPQAANTFRRDKVDEAAGALVGRFSRTRMSERGSAATHGRYLGKEWDLSGDEAAGALVGRFSRTRMSEKGSGATLGRYLDEKWDPSSDEAAEISFRNWFAPERRRTVATNQQMPGCEETRPLQKSSLRTVFERKKVRTPATFVVAECPVCTDQKRLLKVPLCGCTVCSDCLCQQVEVRLQNDSSVSGLTCPVCDQLDDLALTDTSCEFFPQLQSLLAGKLKPGVMLKLDERLRDWRLKLTDNFCWCSGCSNGFEVSEHHDRRVRCGQCGKETCRKCSKAWHEQHRGVSCQQFALWRQRTDAGELGLAQFLESRGSSCPECGFQFELSRGGCLHLVCRQCKAEFCSDCGSLFVRQECCGGNKGLHCHHGEECIETFRDWPIERVRQAAQERGVQLERALVGAGRGGRCSVQEQKDTAGGGLEDGECGRPAIEAGLCEPHLKEALVSAMRQNNVSKAKVPLPTLVATPPSASMSARSAMAAQRPKQLDISVLKNNPNRFINRSNFMAESPSREARWAHPASEICTSLDGFACPHCTAVSPSAPCVSGGSRVLCAVCGKTTPSRDRADVDDDMAAIFNSYDMDLEGEIVW